MPTIFGAGEGVEVLPLDIFEPLPISCSERGLGIGGALDNSHFRWTRAPFNRSKKIFSPPARKENLILSTKEPSVRLRSLRIGPGESERESWEERSPIRRSTVMTSDAPQISQFRSDGSFSNVQRGQRTLAF